MEYIPSSRFSWSTISFPICTIHLSFVNYTVQSASWQFNTDKWLCVFQVQEKHCSTVPLPFHWQFLLQTLHCSVLSQLPIQHFISSCAMELPAFLSVSCLSTDAQSSLSQRILFLLTAFKDSISHYFHQYLLGLVTTVTLPSLSLIAVNFKIPWLRTAPVHQHIQVLPVRLFFFSLSLAS